MRRLLSRIRWRLFDIFDGRWHLPRDERGAVIVEFAFLLGPILLIGLGCCDLAVMYSSKQATLSTAQDCASVGGRLLKQQNGDIAAARAAANSTFTANQAAFALFGTMTLNAVDPIDQFGAITAIDTNAVAIRCTVAQSTNIYFPLGIFPNPFAFSLAVQS